MECKCFLVLTGARIGEELIDTLWNVNNNLQYNSDALNCELIDTLWNVNEISCKRIEK